MTLMKTSQRGRDLIREFEGLQLKAYKALPTEKYHTIGYGHYGPDVSPTAVITRQRAEELLDQDLRPVEEHLNRLHVNFTQGQFDALASLIYNIGIGNFASSTLRHRIAENDSDEAIRSEFLRWVYSGGKKVNGLVTRRQREAAVFLSET